jgi:branched-chain amino acid transport system permease protein
MKRLTQSRQISTPDWLVKERQLILGLIILFSFYFMVIIQQYLIVHKNFGIALQIVLNGAIISVIYAIFALGFSLIYGIAKQLKLSAGGYYVLAAYTMYFLLQAIKIDPSFELNIDSFILLALYFLPFILVGMILIFLWSRFSFQQFLLILFASLIAIIITVYFNAILPNLFQAHTLLEGIYVVLALLLACLGAWYLELPKRDISIGSVCLSFLLLVIVFVKLPLIYLALIISVVMFTACVAMLSDRYLLNKVRDSHVNVMIVTFALALLIQSIIQIMYFPKNGNELTQFGSHDYTLPAVVSISKILGIYGARILEVKIVSFIFVIVAVVLLYLFIWKTRMGIALRAVSQDEEASSLTGIDIRKTTAVVSGIGMGLIAFAAVLTSPFAVILWNPYMGWPILIMAIAVVTLGGLGSLPGSIIAAFIIGYAETIVSSISDIAQFSVVLPLVVVFIVMIIKPEGLLGEKKELEG